jgi:hypothetical protein
MANTNSEALLAQATDQIEFALTRCSLEEIKAIPQMKRAIALATGMKAIRAALTTEVVKELFMPLQGSALGFRTDKDKDGGYDIATVTDCLIEALIRGFSPVGNEFNIIARRAYFTKEGLERKVAEWPGISGFESAPGVPFMTPAGNALVAYRGRWLLNGELMVLNCDRYPVELQDADGQAMRDADGKVLTRDVDERIPVIVNSGMGPDAILGKARRKYLNRVLLKLGGQLFAVPDGDASEVIETTGSTVDPKEATKARVDKLVDERRAAKQSETRPEPAKPKIDPSTGEVENPGTNG